MKKTKTLILGILATFSACQAPKIEPQVRRVWSANFNTCYCQYYNLSTVEKLTDLKPCEDFYNVYFPDLPVLDNPDYCDDLVGFNASTWAKAITPWGKELMRWGEDTCK